MQACCNVKIVNEGVPMQITKLFSIIIPLLILPFPVLPFSAYTWHKYVYTVTYFYKTGHIFTSLSIHIHTQTCLLILVHTKSQIHKHMGKSASSHCYDHSIYAFEVFTWVLVVEFSVRILVSVLFHLWTLLLVLL